MSPPSITRRQLLRQGARWLAGTGGTAGVYGWRVEPHWVEFTQRALPIHNLPQRLVGTTLIQVSDLHVGEIVAEEYLRGVLRRVAALRPEIIVITGDFMTSHDREQIGRVGRILAELEVQRQPTLAVLGNHDYGPKFRDAALGDELVDELRRAGVEVLRNQVTDVHALQFAGADDLFSGQMNLTKTLSELDSKSPHLVLTHNPDSADLPGWNDYQGWILCGHTHGGQCWFPLLGAPIVPIKNKRYTRGEIDLGDGRKLYVNRGVGYLRRVRFMVRPEVTQFVLAAA